MRSQRLAEFPWCRDDCVARRRWGAALGCVLLVPAAIAAATGIALAGSDSVLLAHWTRAPVRLDSTEVSLELASTEAGRCSDLLDIGDDSRLTLVLRGLKSKAEPEVAFRVFLGRPQTVHEARLDPGYIADLTFFGTSLLPKGSAVSYEVSGPLRRLKHAGLLHCPIIVSFLSDRAPSQGSEPTVAEVELWRTPRKDY